MIKRNKKFNVKYLYHYTKKENVDKIIQDGEFKSIDEYLFFTGSLEQSVESFENEMMSNNYYIDVDLKLKRRSYAFKNDYVILKVPYVEDNKFLMFDFHNKNSIYNTSIVHEGLYQFNKIEVLEFPKESSFKFNPLFAKLFISLSFFMPCSLFADSWLDTNNYDTVWYDSNNTSYIIDDAKELAGLAYLVNHDNVSFEGKIINVQADMSLLDHDWEAISNIFNGVIDGSHRILMRKNTSLFSSNNNQTLSLVYHYNVKLFLNDGTNKNIYLLGTETINELKSDLTSKGLFTSSSLLMKNDNVLNTGNVTDNNIVENSELHIYTGYVIIKQGLGNYFGLTCESGDAIETIKSLIHDKKNINVNRMKLYYNDTELVEQRTLADYNINKKSILILKILGEVKVIANENGTTTVDKTVASEGEKVKITVTPNKNYHLKEVKIYNESNEDVTSLLGLSDNEFTMPKYTISIKTIYEMNQKEIIINPKTNDSIYKYLIQGIVSLIGGISTVIYLFKIKKY